MQKHCENCDCIYITSHPKTSKHCSRKCLSEVYKRTMLGSNNPNYKNSRRKTCLFCEKNYLSYNKERKFCSQSCSLKFRWLFNRKSIIRKPKKKKKKPVPKIKITKTRPSKKWYCLECSTEVERRVKWCCSSCRKQFHLIKIQCTHCKKDILRYKKQIIKDKNFFCSKKCQVSNPKFNPNWRGGKKTLSSLIRDCDKNKFLIKKILKRDRYTCKYCNQVGGQLEVDHIKKFSLIFDNFIKINKEEKDKYILLNLAQKHEPFWNEENLQVLCKKCNWNKEIQYRKLGY